MFFAPRDPATALGMYTTGYFITLAVVLVIIGILLYKCRHLQVEKVKWIILGIGLFCLVTEIIKMIFTGVRYGINSVEWIPLYYCSCYIYACFMALSKWTLIKRAGIAFIFFGGIIGGLAFFCYPNACIPNYPLLHFMTLRTFIFHGSMVFLGLLVVITGYYKPNKKDFLPYISFLGIVSALAYIANMIFHKNFMYMSEPLNIGISKALFEIIPNIYPFIFITLQLIVPFLVTYGIYQLFNLEKEHEKCLQ